MNGFIQMEVEYDSSIGYIFLKTIFFRCNRNLASYLAYRI